MDALNPTFKVIIAHKDAVAALQATNVLKQVATHLETRLGVDINPWEICSHVWNFDSLQDPQSCEQAVAEAITADMIIISTEGYAELPACVRGWIESVLPRKQAMPAALVALFDGNRDTRVAALPPVRYLRQLAHQYGVDFLSNAQDHSWPDESSMKSFLSRYEDDPAFAQEVISNGSDRRGWGIND